ncbi:hypothetical protein Tco_0733858 [Tanacetum coccineum]
MNPSAANQIALDNALVAPEARLKIGECNRRIEFTKPQREATCQVTLDALKLSPCYPAFLITVGVLEIYMHQFWNIVTKLSSTDAFPKRPLDLITLGCLELKFYETYYAYASGAKEAKKARKFKKPASPKLKTILVSPKEPTKKPAKGKKDVSQTRKPATKPKPTKKKAPVKADRDKGDGTNFELWVPDEQQRKISSTDKGTGIKPGVPNVPKYVFESKKESWGNNGEDDDDNEDDSEDESDDDNNDDDGDYNNDEDKNDDDDEADSDRTESDRSKIPDLNQSNEEHEKEEEEYADKRVHNPKNYELTDEEDNANNAKEENEEEKDDAEELYRDVNVNLRKEDVEMTDANQGGADKHNVSQESGFERVEEDAHVTLTAVHDTQKTEGPMQSSSVSSDFTDKLLNFENTSPADNEIASLMDTTVRHEEPSSQTSSLFTVPVTVIPEITSAFTTTIPPPPPSFNPLPQQATPTPTPTASKATTSFPALPDFSSVFRFNERVTNLEKDLLEMKQVDQEEALADKREYIDLIDTSVRAIIKEEVKTQLPQILPQAVSEFATPVIERNVTESLEAVVLAKSSSQPKSTYEAAASLSEFELTKILMDKMEEHKSYLRADYKRELYDALVKSYNTDKDLFETYGEVFTLKRSRDDKDKDQDPSAGSDRGTKIRKSSKSGHTEEKSHTINDSGVRQNQEFNTGKNDEQPDDEAASKVVYDKHAYWGTSHWGPKRQRFYGFANNRKSKHDVDSRKRIIAVTSLKIMKWYDYSHLEEIEVRREDQ